MSPRLQRHSSGAYMIAVSANSRDKVISCISQNIPLNAVLNLINCEISDLLGVGSLQHVAD
jgi:hypothetical protein